MNTLVSAVSLVVAVLVAQASSALYYRKVPLVTVGSKTFYTLDGHDWDVFEGAYEACERNGLKIAMVENKAESDALTAIANTRSEQGLHYKFWIGAVYKRWHERKWIWHPTKKELTFSDWKPHITKLQPYQLEDHCGMIDADPQWSEGVCDIDSGVPVCQE